MDKKSTNYQYIYFFLTTRPNFSNMFKYVDSLIPEKLNFEIIPRFNNLIKFHLKNNNSFKFTACM